MLELGFLIVLFAFLYVLLRLLIHIKALVTILIGFLHLIDLMLITFRHQINLIIVLCLIQLPLLLRLPLLCLLIILVNALCLQQWMLLLVIVIPRLGQFDAGAPFVPHKDREDTE